MEIKLIMASRGTGKSMWTQQAIDRLMNDLMNRPVEELILNETRVSGSRYYTIEPVGGNWKDMEDWCFKSFGNPGDMWNSSDWVCPESARWMMNDRKFLFRHQKDRDWFMLRWL